MPELVTLNSAPYNPYNETFARFAMEGLQMGIQQMQHRDAMMQHQADQQQSFISENTRNMFKAEEMQMQNKEFEHRVQNDLFNQHLQSEQFAFNKDSFWKRFGLDEKRETLAENQFTYNKEHDAKVDDPFKIAQTKSLQMTNEFNADTMQAREDELNATVTSKKLANEDKLIENQIGQMNLDVYRKNPGMIEQEKQAALDLKKAQAVEEQAHADYWKQGGSHSMGDNMNLSTLLMRQKQQVDNLNKLRDDISKLGPDETITERQKSRPQAIKDLELRNKDKQTKRQELQDSYDQTHENLAWLSKQIDARMKAVDDGGGINAPASTKSSVPLPGADTGADTPAARILQQQRNKTAPAQKTGSKYEMPP